MLMFFREISNMKLFALPSIRVLAIDTRASHWRGEVGVVTTINSRGDEVFIAEPGGHRRL
jgi:hypothetical protein